ncbi:type I polyketide synthase [Oceanicella actignis]|uniref:type I polyketide synthase n=1 Tax=Oceanicella actignis TaxID=1189325 RepID=UPI0011E612F8|nr:type I polyketide synthase [Oceanicella actignis]TYO84854.1 acyl transferase domain-containing protein [Oceanicella actignis]
MLKPVEPREAAIIGYACRLPGARSPEEFWSVLMQGRCTVSQVQSDRWIRERFAHPDVPRAGRAYTFAAGQLDAPFDFDAGFFGISPREAEQMDPQQRLLLEVTWEALEKAGLRPSALRKDRAGVFVGASASDYSNHLNFDPTAAGAQFMTGNTLSLISNRLSYVLDLHGPSFTVDTACSSGLYALHAAVEAIAAGRVETAIVGAVNMLLSPFPFIGFSQATMLSPSGLCRAFDARGDGYVRSEGAVTFVLKDLAAAIADQDRILGVVSGAEVNSDGRTTGVSMPSAERQAELLRASYARLGIDPERLAFVEAHGTGTRVGDPVEATALGRVLGARRAAPLPVGSAKTNVGHLEPASGLVGLLKAQLALEHGVLPRSLHFETPNPDIDFAGLNLRVAAEEVPLPESGAPLYAGVNSFGFGGANAHAVLRQPSEAERRRPPAQHEPAPLIISARSEESLRALAGAWRDRLRGASADEAARLANAAAYRRERLSHRLIVVPSAPEAQAAALDAYLAGNESADLAVGRAMAGQTRTAFVYSGNGAQFVGMGRAAYAADPVFRARFDEVSAIFERLSEVSLTQALHDQDLERRLRATSLAQPLLFAIQVGVTESLAEKGLTPDAVIGHSVGEVAAAWAAGAFDLPDAVRLIHVRSHGQEPLRGLGGMAAALAPADKVEQLLAQEGLEEVCLAAENSPRSVTVSGPEAALDAFARAARKRRIAVRRLDLEYPFHSPLADRIVAPLAAELAWARPDECRARFVSATWGRPADGQELGPAYWIENIRQPVRFRAGVEALIEDGCGVFVEIGPRPVLLNYLRDVAEAKARPAAALPSLEERDEAPDLRRVAARAATQGARLAERRFFGPDRKAAEDLPAYPWRRQTFRLALDDEAIRMLEPGRQNPLLGFAARQHGRDWRAAIDARCPAWLGDHRVGGSVVAPGAAFADMALSAGRAALAEGPIELVDLDILRALALDDEAGRETRVRLEGERAVVSIESRARLAGEDFALHARGRVRRAFRAPPPPRPAPEAPATMDRAALYERARRIGIEFGPSFRRAAAVMRLDAQRAYSRLDAEGLDLEAHTIHPILLDAAFHGLLAMVPEAARAGGPARAFLPIRIGRLTLFGPADGIRGAWIEILRAGPREIVARFTLVGHDGAPLAEADEVRFKAVEMTRSADPRALVYRNALERLAPPEGRAAAPLDPVAESARALAAETPPEPGAGALLIDTLARRAAFDAAAALAREGVIDPAAMQAEGRLAENARPLLWRILTALEDDGALVRLPEGAFRLAEAPYPSAEQLTEALLAEAPRRINELMRIIDAAERLPRALAEGLGAGDEPRTAAQLRMRAAGPAGEARWAALERLLDALLADAPAPAARRICVLVLGAAPAALVDRLAEAAEAGRLARAVIADPDPRRARALAMADPGRAGLRFAALDELPDAPDFDLVLCADALARMGADALAALRRRLAPGALVAAVEEAPGLALDLTEGLAAPWWRDTLDPQAPLGLQKDGAEWAADLARAGFEGAAAAALDSAETQAALLTARAPAQAAAGAERPGGRAPAEPAQGDAAAAQDGAAEPGLPPGLLVVAPEGREAAARALADALGAHGIAARASALAELGAAPEGAELLFLPAEAPDRADETDEAATRIMALRRALTEARAPSRVWVVTRGGVAAGAGRRLRPLDAAMWGLTRVAANEFPALDLRLADFDPELDDDAFLAALAAELRAPAEDRETVHDRLGRSGVRVQRAPDLPDRARAAAAGGAAIRRLEIARQGDIDTLEWRVAPRPDPAPDQIEIEILAAGLNFRDVMWAQGLLPEEALEDGFAGPTLGMECSGVVTRVGAACTRFKPGDQVIAFASSCFASHACVREDAAAPLPEGVEPLAAATIPAAFLTAWYGLVQLANLSRGETALIHGGAGGVGLAAIQIAAARGARVIATAGTPARRALLRRLGAWRVFDSRSLDFAAQVLEATGGQGVDVALNSLSGEALERTLECLRPFGRFIELGKRDFYADSQIGLRPFRRNLTYFGVDADQLLVHRPELARRMFEALGGLFARGDLAPLPHAAFDPSDVADAFRLMQKSGHVGKILIRAPRAPAPAARAAAPALRPDGAWLVIGGLGGFGAETAAWLVERGARRVWLTSRGGRPTEGARAAIRRMEAAGAAVEIRAVDAADQDAMRALIAEIEGGPAPLRGVIHAAMVLEDGLLANQETERVRRVLRPKIAGARNADLLTRGLELDMFVVFSSATTLIGNPGQAAYVAANAYLEALMAERRRAGLPGLAMAWGAISDAGYLTRDEQTQKLLSGRLGAAALTAREALAGLEMALAAQDPADLSAIGYAQLDWASARRELALTATPLFARLPMPRLEAGAGAGAADLAALVRGLPEDEALRLVIERLAQEASRILRLPVEEIDPAQPLTDMGFDSLMAVDLRMAAEEKLGVDLPLMSLSGGATLTDVAARALARALEVEAAPNEADGDARAAAELAERHVAEGVDPAALAEIARRADETGRAL